MLVSEVKTAFQAYKQDISDVDDALFIRWCDYVNKRAYYFLRDQAPERFISTQSYTVSTSPSSQSLPADFQDMNVLGTGLYKQDNGNPTTRKLPMTGYGSEIFGFWLDASNVNFTGINTSTTYVLRYIPTLSTLDELTDSLVIPDRFLLYVRDAVDVMYSQWDEDRGGEGIADTRFVRDLDEIIRNIRLQPATYSFFDISSAY